MAALEDVSRLAPGARRPRVLFVSRTRYRLPLAPSLERKWNALRSELDLRVLATADGGTGSDGDFVLARAASGVRFWALLPLRSARELRRFRPDAVVAQSPYEATAALLARRLARARVPVVCEIHGDWRTATRLYGSRLRGSLSLPADLVTAAVLRRVEAVRTVSPYTSGLARELGIEPAACYPAALDLDTFLARAPVAPPDQPRALFVGVLERYKNVDGLAAGWRLLARRLPHARLHIVGKGSQERVVRELLRDCPRSTTWTPQLDAAGVAAALDDATLLVLPSRSEGMGRILIEAACRARPVVGTEVGGIADIVEDGVTGLLVEPGSTPALAAALAQLLAQPALAHRLGANARAHIQPWLQTPEQYATRTRALLDRLLDSPPTRPPIERAATTATTAAQSR